MTSDDDHNEAARQALEESQFKICLRLKPFPRGSLILMYLSSKRHLNDAEVDWIEAPEVDNQRSTRLITCLKAKITTTIFIDFLHAIRDGNIGNNSSLADDILKSYKQTGGDNRDTKQAELDDVTSSLSSVSLKPTKSVEKRKTAPVASGRSTGCTSSTIVSEEESSGAKNSPKLTNNQNSGIGSVDLQCEQECR